MCYIVGPRVPFMPLREPKRDLPMEATADVKSALGMRNPDRPFLPSHLPYRWIRYKQKVFCFVRGKAHIICSRRIGDYS